MSYAWSKSINNCYVDKILSYMPDKGKGANFTIASN